MAHRRSCAHVILLCALSLLARADRGERTLSSFRRLLSVTALHTFIAASQLRFCLSAWLICRLSLLRAIAVTADYAYMWARDFPRLRSMGVNTLRVYSWGQTADHTAFLDTCAQYGLKVFVTHALGYAKDNPVDTVAKQQALIANFADEVKRYGDHPAILMWSFGNELNGYWLGFLDQVSALLRVSWAAFGSVSLVLTGFLF